MSLIIFIFVLSTLVIVHEWGHFISAKTLGVKVERFSVGFGPKLFSRLCDGTEFMVCAIPLGGYVKMAGDERTECQGHREEFFSHPIWHRAIIVTMGPVVNFVFAFVCFYVIMVTGFPALAPKVGKVMDGYPAQIAGLAQGDQILKINGETIESWDDLQELVSGSGGQALSLRIQRGKELVTREVVPQQRVIKNILRQEEHVYLIGIQPEEELITLHYGPVQAVGEAWGQILQVVTMTFKALSQVVVGAMPAKEAFGGPIRIFDVISSAAEMGLSSLIYIMGIISTSLAIFNLFPFPVLDGGHLLIMSIEKFRGRPLSAKVEEGLTRAGFTLLICLMLYVMYNDILEVGWLGKIKDFWTRVFIRP